MSLVKKKYLIQFILFSIVLLVMVIILYTLSTKNVVKEEIVEPEIINIFWAEWPPADYLQELSRDFTRETGIEVNIIQESWSTWQTTFFHEMAEKGQRFDMVIGDSQWLGRGSVGGHYIELTKWLQEKNVDKTMTPASITGYSEFPKGSGHYWAIPLEGDATGFCYRKDLFENPQEKQAFKAKYGYELKIPDTWYQLKDIAEFFYRPEKDFFGVLLFTEPHYDGLTMGIDALIWAWGADLGDPETYRVKGILNSEEGIEALTFYRELNRYNNPEWANYYLDKDSNSNYPIMQGRVAMSMVYFAVTPDLLDPAKNPYANVIGFFANPRGPKMRVTSLAGQGISVVSYTKKKALCFKFLEWLTRDDVQEKWATSGGLSCNINVLNSEKFLNASPVNRPYKESIEMVKDFWAVPEYPQLLAISQKYWSEYVNEGKFSAKYAMDNVAQNWEYIFESAGYYKE